jgi:hypothetical protein
MFAALPSNISVICLYSRVPVISVLQSSHMDLFTRILIKLFSSIFKSKSQLLKHLKCVNLTLPVHLQGETKGLSGVSEEERQILHRWSSKSRLLAACD